MIYGETDDVVFFVIIAKRREKDAILDSLSALDIHLTNIVYGRGSVRAGYLRDVLGLVPEDSKVALLSVSTRAKADAVLKMMIEKFEFNKANTGIAYTVPVESLAY